MSFNDLAREFGLGAEDSPIEAPGMSPYSSRACSDAVDDFFAADIYNSPSFLLSHASTNRTHNYEGDHNLSFTPCKLSDKRFADLKLSLGQTSEPKNNYLQASSKQFHYNAPEGFNPRANHEIRLRRTSELPDVYRTLFSFGVFNAMQSKSFDIAFQNEENLVVSAPTGSGKTIIFELAIIRLLQHSDDFKCVYMAPTKALCSERFRDWTKKFEPLGAELTGDTTFGNSAWVQATSSRIIVTTPEKWDSLTRNWSEHAHVLSQVRLLMVDEIHILNEARGSTLEVCVSRMKTQGTGVRFVLVSATIPNIDDIANWVGSLSSEVQAASVLEFGDEFRPCKLTRHVYGFPRKQQNEWQFNHLLDSKIFGILQQHIDGKPVLVFCPTRKSVLGTAERIVADYNKLKASRGTLPWPTPEKIDRSFEDEGLNAFASCGVGIHHAGLSLDDRRLAEELYLKRILLILVCTSTLAVGVNLPAHTVVVKGVHMWVDSGWKEYLDLDILQMIGRAGRQQFDKEGVAIIMCDCDQEKKYLALSSGRTVLESSLHLNLPEHINSEICLGTIHDTTSAKEWIRNSFLYHRIQKNPKYYQIDKAAGNSWQNRLDAIVATSIASLKESGLVSNIGEGEQLIPTQYGDIMAKSYIRQPTMSMLLKIPERATMRDLLGAISQSAEFNDLRLRPGEKQVYKKLREHPEIRYEMKRVERLEDKVLLLIQAVLGGISLNSPEYKAADATLYLDSLFVFKHAARISRTIVDVGIARKAGGMIKNGLELFKRRNIIGRVWEDRPVVLRQIKQIGQKSVKVLAENKVLSLSDLHNLDPSKIELLLNRKPPFGSHIHAALRSLPRYYLKIAEEYISTGRGNDPIQVTLSVTCGLLTDSSQYKNTKQSFQPLGMTTILSLTSDLDMIDFRRIATKSLKEFRTFSINVNLMKPSQSVIVSVSPDDFGGLTVTQTYKPSIPPSHYPTLETRPQKDIWVGILTEEAALTESWFQEDELAGLQDDPDFWNEVFGDDADLEGQPSTCPNTKPHMGKTNHRMPSKDVGTPTLATKPSRSHSTLHAKAESGKLPNGNYACNHSCKDKAKCRHLCCREGTTKPTPSKRALDRPSKHESRSANLLGAPGGNKDLDQLDNLHRKINRSTINIPTSSRFTLDRPRSTSSQPKLAHNVTHSAFLVNDQDVELPGPANIGPNTGQRNSDDDMDAILASFQSPQNFSSEILVAGSDRFESPRVVNKRISRNLSPLLTDLPSGQSSRQAKRQKVDRSPEERLFLPDSSGFAEQDTFNPPPWPMSPSGRAQGPIEDFVLDPNMFEISSQDSALYQLPVSHAKLPSDNTAPEIPIHIQGNFAATTPTARTAILDDPLDGMDLVTWLTQSGSIVISSDAVV